MLVFCFLHILSMYLDMLFHVALASSSFGPPLHRRGRCVGRLLLTKPQCALCLVRGGSTHVFADFMFVTMLHVLHALGARCAWRRKFQCGSAHAQLLRCHDFGVSIVQYWCLWAPRSPMRRRLTVLFSGNCRRRTNVVLRLRPD